MKKIYLFIALFFCGAVCAQIPVGVCTGLDQAARIDGDSTGCSYVEVGVQSVLVPEKPDSVFQLNLQKMQNLKIPARSANGFFPSDLRLVGPDVDTSRMFKYVRVAMERAGKAGIGIVVLGSGGARRIPEGIDRDMVEEQFVSYCRRFGEIAAKYGVVIVIEPLNAAETNFINSVLEGADIVRKVNHPNFRLLADFYHMARAEEDVYNNLVSVGDCLCHCHIAENQGRTAPGVHGEDFSLYFSALKKIGYKGSISIECSGPKDLKRNIDYIEKFW